jgi:serine/threonine protein phosphatase PrpC
MMAEVDLAFVARQLERLINDMAGLKDDMTVVMARLDRIDATSHSLVTEVRAMHSRHDRLARRVERLEDASQDAPS